MRHVRNVIRYLYRPVSRVFEGGDLKDLLATWPSCALGIIA